MTTTTKTMIRDAQAEWSADAIEEAKSLLRMPLPTRSAGQIARNIPPRNWQSTPRDLWTEGMRLADLVNGCRLYPDRERLERLVYLRKAHPRAYSMATNDTPAIVAAYEPLRAAALAVGDGLAGVDTELVDTLAKALLDPPMVESSATIIGNLRRTLAAADTFAAVKDAYATARERRDAAFTAQSTVSKARNLLLGFPRADLQPFDLPRASDELDRLLSGRDREHS